MGWGERELIFVKGNGEILFGKRKRKRRDWCDWLKLKEGDFDGFNGRKRGRFLGKRKDNNNDKELLLLH